MQALVIGSFEAHERQALRYAAARADTELEFHEDFATALLLLETGGASMSCFLVTGDCCAAVSEWVRDHALFFNLPIVALVRQASDRAYHQAYRDGADDVVRREDLGGITRRLANLSERPSDMRPPANQGLGIIAFPDVPRRRVLGRTLRTAGFDVAYAVSQEELMNLVRGPIAPTLIVTHPSFPHEGGVAAVNAIRAQISAPKLPGLLLPAYPEEEAEAAPVTGSQETGKLLFFAEEALRGDVADLRASARLLYNGLCAFREAGTLEPVYGFTHNISRQGLYVRTLDPPKPGCLIWFELRVPGEGEVMIHLRGQVMWRREAKHMGGAAPAGFGMRIENAQCPPLDLALYQQAYEELGQQQASESRSLATVSAAPQE